MVAPKTLHSVEAISCSVRIEPDTPRAVLVGLQLSSGDLLSVAMPRETLQRLVHQSQRAMKAAPLPARRAYP
jgi:hypothetical protein